MESTDWIERGYLDRARPGPAGRLRQIRHTVAMMFVPSTLRGRLLLLVAVVIATVIGATEYLESRFFERAATQELLQSAQSTAVVVADDLEVRRTALDPAALAERLHEFGEAVPAVRAISILTLVQGQPKVLASTASDVSPEAMEAGRLAVEARATTWVDRGVIRIVATPFGPASRPADGAVVVSVSLAVVSQIGEQSWTIALWLVPGVILLLTGLVDLLGDRFVHRPLSGIRQSMRRATEGDLTARAPVVRDDELGAVARGLNDMLARLEDASTELQQRVDAATRTLQRRNEELTSSYQRVIALREALARAEQMAAVGYLAAKVAHQVGTPLNLVSGYVQVIRQEEIGNERLSHRLAIVAEQIDKVTTELRALLDRARLPAPRQNLRVADLIDRVAEVARPRVDRQHVHLETRVDPGCPPVTVDAVQIELAILNLVTNSLDAMPDGGALTLAARPSGSGVALEIRDTGTGVTAELLPRIFEPWVTTKAPGRGTGLGLSIARDTVLAHAGTISARSEPGSGTVIVIELPAAEEPPSSD